MAPPLVVWTIYHNPLDYPGRWVLRGHDIPEGGADPIARKDCVVGSSREEMREALPDGVLNLGRQSEDHISVVESWI